MKIRQIMTRKPRTAKETATIASIVKTMDTRRIGSMIIEKDGKPVGIITERDLLHKVLVRCKDPEKTHAAQVMTRHPKTADADDSEAKVLFLMTKNRIKKVIVTDKGRIIGIVTQTDILKKLG